MKTVDVAFKKIEIMDYYSQLDQVQVRILFNDGTDKGLMKQITITEPAKHVEEWMQEIRTKLKEAHKQNTLEDHPLADVVLLRYKQEQDVLQEKMTKFLAQARERIRSGKMSKLSYYDMEKKIKGFTAKLD
ncbi:MAG TPA: hypothetical protein VI612_04005 [Candidatus Nanoarchaeia archaeon]|nr:hypothetical protein [Candidatus Nanoarchaeia archaeon]